MVAQVAARLPDRVLLVQAVAVEVAAAILPALMAAVVAVLAFLDKGAMVLLAAPVTVVVAVVEAQRGLILAQLVLVAGMADARVYMAEVREDQRLMALPALSASYGLAPHGHSHLREHLRHQNLTGQLP
jgi:hypothetical protein